MKCKLVDTLYSKHNSNPETNAVWTAMIDKFFNTWRHDRAHSRNVSHVCLTYREHVITVVKQMIT